MRRTLVPQPVQLLDGDPVTLPSPPPLGAGQIEDQLSLPGDTRCPVADPLSRYEDRQLDVELQLHHFERRRVLMPHQVADEPAVLADALRAEAVADARRLHDRGVAPHVVHEVDETVIEAGNFPPDPLLRLGSGETPIRFVQFTFLGHSSASSRLWAGDL